MGLDFNAFQMGQQAVGDPVTEAMQRQQGQLSLQAQGLQNQGAIQQMQMQKAALQRQQQYTQDVQAFAQKPSVNGLAALWKYPEFQASTKGIYDQMDPRMRQQEVTQLGSVASLLQSNDLTGASKIVQSRIDADKAAGLNTTGDEQALAMINSGDPKQINAAKAMIAGLMAGSVGFDKAAEYLKAIGLSQEPISLSNDSRLVTQQGNTIVAADPKPDFLVVPEGGKAIPLNAAASAVGTGGGGQTSGGAGAPTPAASSGPDDAIAHILKHEGGYLAKDGNGYPTNFGINAKANSAELNKLKIADIATMTKPQAIQIYKDKYWPASGAASLPANLQAPYFDVYIRSPVMAKQLLAKSGGDSVTFATMAKETFQRLAQKNPEKYGRFANAWANRDDDNIATARAGASSSASPAAATSPPPHPGDIPGTVYGSPKPQARTLTTQEATARGLSPAKVYEERPDGTVSAIGDAAPADAPGDSSLSGPAYIAQLAKTNPSLANQVQGVMDTRLAYPPATARSSAAQQLRAAVLQADPSYDEQAYKRRQTTIQQYTPGHTGPGQSMLSAATIINHMYDLAQAARDLPDHATAAQNAISAWGAGQTNQPWLIKFNEGRKFVASELPKFLNGKAPTEGEQREHYDSYSPSKGKSGIQTALSTDVDYLYGRYQPLIQAYKDNTGKDLNIDTYAPGQATRAKAAALEYYRANGALPIVVTSAAQAAKLPHGSIFVTPDARILRRH